ncbi:MAG: adaptor protein MecA [Lachnospiraceae bacterium]|nr:adaptor protein MecA [Lachnospiraceae bacterium]
MKFTKIDKNTLRCLISREEMDERGIKIDDIMVDRGKAEAFLRDILMEAKAKVNFVTSGEALNVQLSVLKNGSLNLQITDDRNASIRMLLEQIKARLAAFSEQIANGSGNSANVVEIPPQGSVIPEYKTAGKFIAKVKDNPVIKMHVWARLASMEDCITLSKAMAKDRGIPSKLYELNGNYYFEIDINDVKSVVARIVFTLSEHSVAVFSDDGFFMEAKEHGKCLIKEKAFETLSNF